MKIHPTVETQAIHLPGERTVLIRNSRLPRILKSSTLERYLARTATYRNLDYMGYSEKFKMYEKLPLKYRSDSNSIPRDSANPKQYIVKRERDEICVARIRTVSPAKVELFALRLIIMHRRVSSFEDAKKWEARRYPTYRESAVAMGLYEDGYDFDKAFDEAVRIYATPAELRRMVVTLYQQGGNPKRMIEKHGDIPISDITSGSTSEKKMEMMTQIIEVADRHGGRLLRELSFFQSVAQSSRSGGTELDRARTQAQANAANRQRLDRRYRTLKTEQKDVFDKIMSTLSRRERENGLKTDETVLFLQGHAGTGKTYLLSLLRDMARSKAMLVEISATTGIAASLYEGGRTLHSLLGLEIDDKDSSERYAKLSKYGPRSQRGILIKALSLLIIDEASMMQRVLFEHVDTILKGLRCTGQSSSARSKPYFGGLTVVLARDYMQLIPVVPSLKLDVDSSGEARHIPVNLLDEIPWRSTFWEKVKTLRISHPIRQADDRQFSDLLRRIGKGRFPQDEKLPLKSTGSPEEAYKFIWK